MRPWVIIFALGLLVHGCTASGGSEHDWRTSIPAQSLFVQDLPPQAPLSIDGPKVHLGRDSTPYTDGSTIHIDFWIVQTITIQPPPPEADLAWQQDPIHLNGRLPR